MDSTQRRRRRRAKALWRVINPPTRILAGLMPWWVLLVTTGHRTGHAHRTPLACGPNDGQRMWLIAAHGPHADYVANLVADPRVRLRHRGHWYTGVATVDDLKPEIVDAFNACARGALRLAIDPRLIRVDYTPRPRETGQ